MTRKGLVAPAFNPHILEANSGDHGVCICVQPGRHSELSGQSELHNETFSQTNKQTKKNCKLEV